MKSLVFGYVRVSSRGQLDKDGPVRQEEAIRRFAKASDHPSCRFEESKKFAQSFGVVVPGDPIRMDDATALAAV